MGQRTFGAAKLGWTRSNGYSDERRRWISVRTNKSATTRSLYHAEADKGLVWGGNPPLKTSNSTGMFHFNDPHIVAGQRGENGESHHDSPVKRRIPGLSASSVWPNYSNFVSKSLTRQGPRRVADQRSAAAQGVSGSPFGSPAADSCCSHC